MNYFSSLETCPKQLKTIRVSYSHCQFLVKSQLESDSDLVINEFKSRILQNVSFFQTCLLMGTCKSAESWYLGSVAPHVDAILEPLLALRLQADTLVLQRVHQAGHL